MLKVKYEDLDGYNLSELKEIIKQLNEDNKEKDNIIKELEKFGFEYKTSTSNITYYNLGKDELGANNRIVVIEKDRHMEINIDTDLKGYSEELGVLYNLIQAGLVEKENGLLKRYMNQLMNYM